LVIGEIKKQVKPEGRLSEPTDFANLLAWELALIEAMP
jgi:hypothetical protein